MIRKYHNHKLQTNPWYREEEPLNHHETPGRQIKQSNQLSLPHQDDCNTTGGHQRNYNITHMSLRACMHCMYWYGILEGTRAWRYNYRDGEGDTAPENFGIYSFIERDLFDFLRPKDE